MGIELFQIKINFERFELFVVVVGRAPLYIPFIDQVENFDQDTVFDLIEVAISSLKIDRKKIGDITRGCVYRRQ